MPKITLSDELFTRGVEDIITKTELEERLASGKKLRIKLGIDATAPDLHIGHAVPLWKIRALQEAGHKAVIILGEFTTKIGDPTGREKERPVLAPEIIRKNIRALKKQVESILLTDKSVYELRKNSEWFGKMKALDFLRLTSEVTHARLIERDMFQERIKKGQEISASEILYPILQGFDSVAIESDLTIIGSDQLFNEHMGRRFQERQGQPPQSIVTLSMLPGLDGGEKMSKSLGNYIAIQDSPQDKFGKAMRIPDELIAPYIEGYTDVPLKDIERMQQELQEGKNPRDAKLFFAEQLVRRYHGEKKAAAERKRFLDRFSKKGIMGIREVEELPMGPDERHLIGLIRLLRFEPSNAEARRRIKEGAVSIDGEVIKDERQWKPRDDMKNIVVRVGKRRIERVKRIVFSDKNHI